MTKETHSFLTIVKRGWTKESLGRRIDEALAAWEPSDVISINVVDQPLYLLGRRNAAYITVGIRNQPQP